MADTITAGTQAGTTQVAGEGQQQQAAPAAAAAAAAQAPAAAATAATPPASAPAAQADKGGKAAEDGPFGPAVKYATTGSQNLDMALDFVGRLGINDQHPAIKAAVNGDFGPIRAVLAEKGVTGADAYVALAEGAFKEMQAHKADKEANTRALGVSIAGSEEELVAVLDWASANAEPNEKAEVNAMLERGGLAAEAVLHYLHNGYLNASGTTRSPMRTAVSQDASARAGAPATPLSPREYGMAVQALRGKLGPGFESSQDYQNLNRRRAAWRG